MQLWLLHYFYIIFSYIDTNVVYKQAEFNLVGLFKRQTDTSWIISSHVSSSLFTCTDRCVKSAQCVAYSYSTQGRDCALFNKTAHSMELAQNPAWKYFEIVKVWMIWTLCKTGKQRKSHIIKLHIYFLHIYFLSKIFMC